MGHGAWCPAGSSECRSRHDLAAASTEAPLRMRRVRFGSVLWMLKAAVFAAVLITPSEGRPLLTITAKSTAPPLDTAAFVGSDTGEVVTLYSVCDSGRGCTTTTNSDTTLQVCFRKTERRGGRNGGVYTIYIYIYIMLGRSRVAINKP